MDDILYSMRHQGDVGAAYTRYLELLSQGWEDRSRITTRQMTRIEEQGNLKKAGLPKVNRKRGRKSIYGSRKKQTTKRKGGPTPALVAEEQVNVMEPTSLVQHKHDNMDKGCLKLDTIAIDMIEEGRMEAAEHASAAQPDTVVWEPLPPIAFVKGHTLSFFPLTNSMCLLKTFHSLMGSQRDLSLFELQAVVEKRGRKC